MATFLFLTFFTAITITICYLAIKLFRSYFAIENLNGKILMFLPKKMNDIFLSKTFYVNKHDTIRYISSVSSTETAVINSLAEYFSAEKRAIEKIVYEAKLLGANAIIEIQRESFILQQIGENSYMYNFICKGRAVEVSIKQS